MADKKTMRVGVVSDTHSRSLPAQMLADFQKVELIIHAGDMCDLADYEALARIREVKGVQGNMDAPAICKRFPRRQIVECGGARIGIFHGEGAPRTILERVQAEFAGDQVDAVIFGHSHVPFNEKIGGVLYFNPGSPNDDIYAHYCSYGILDISAAGITGKIVKVKP